MKKPLFNSAVFILALVGAWKISSWDFSSGVRVLSSSTPPVLITECEPNVQAAIRQNSHIKASVEQKWEQKIDKLTAICKKWTEANQAFYIALYSLATAQQERTGALALFQNVETASSKPVWVFENSDGIELLGLDFFTIGSNGREEFLPLADLNQDRRPEIIFASNNGRNASLFGFELDLNRRKLVPLNFQEKLVDGTTSTTSEVIISLNQRPVARIERNGVASSIITEDAVYTAEKNQWVRSERK